MFGIENPGIYIAYLLVFICTIFAIVYGIVNWNKGKITPEELKEDIEWEEKEEQLKKEISD